MKQDICNREDIQRLVEHFYAKVLEDKALLNHFGKVNWQIHLPRMIGFWDFILFSTPGAYTGSLMPAHAHAHAQMPMKAEDFDSWLALWSHTVDQLFEGPIAEQAKESAKGVGLTIRYKVLGSARTQAN